MIERCGASLRRSPMKKIVIGPTILFVLFAALSLHAWLPLFLPTKHVRGNRHYCDRCGKSITSVSNFWKGDGEQAVAVETQEATDLSRWFVDHFGERCEHHWVRLHTWYHSFLCLADHNVLDLGTETGCSLTPDLLFLNEEELAHLQKLFDEDPAGCREYIHGKLKRRVRADLSTTNDPIPVPEGPAL